MAQQLQPRDYTVAWICAIPVEAHAALSMLDRRDRGTFPLLHGDDNVYEAGRIGDHNVIIACLPEQKTGNVAAARLITQVKMRFQNLRYALMVGIGAGVPGPNGADPDVRLGDVVVAYPTDRSSGIVGYELGKETDDGFLIRQDNSHRMDTVLQNTIRSIKLDNERSRKNNFTQYLNPPPPEIVRKRKYEEEPSKQDSNHITSKFIHPIRHGCTDILYEDETGETLLRQPRRNPEEPVVHYGVIASGDKLVKNAKQREDLRTKYGILCIEMEAAGLRDSYPVAIIRGVSDYADRSKNDDWQAYAAAVAAAYAKEVIYKIPLSLERPGIEKDEIQEKRENILEEDRKACMESLSFEQIDSRYEKISHAHAKTCKWLYRQQEYKDWLDKSLVKDHHGFLWIKGKPGAGKSTIMKHALNSRKKLDGAIILSFFFNARGSILEKSVLGMYRSLVFQLLRAIPSLQDDFAPIYSRKQKDDGACNWEVAELQDFLKSAIKGVQQQQQLVCFIDALDECKESEVREMVEFLENLGESYHKSLSICLASRHYPHISIQKCIELIVENQEGHERDIAKYVQGKFKAPAGAAMDQIRAEILRKASGVFLWVVLVVKILNEEIDHGRRHRLRVKLDEIPDKLDDLFADILSRDNTTRKETTLCLQWLLFTKRPLKCEELYFAVFLGFEPMALNDWDPADQESNDQTVKAFLLSCSKGLAEVPPGKDQAVQFIHESVRDFLILRNGLATLDPALGTNMVGLSEDQVKQCCCDCIVAADFDEIFVDPLPKAKMDETKILQKSVSDRLPFLEYAVYNMFKHSETALGYKVPQDLFLSTFSIPHSRQLFKWTQFKNLFERHSIRRYSSNVKLLYILSDQNLPNLCQILLQNLSTADINAEGERYGSAIQLASIRGHEEIVVQLLNAGANPNTVGRGTLHSLIGAILKRQVVIAELLIKHGAQKHYATADGKTPLWWAIELGLTAMVSNLLVDPGVDIHFKHKICGTPLYLASLSGQTEVVQLLIRSGANVNEQDGAHGNALSAASVIGQKEIVELLLQAGADVNTQGNGYGSALYAASAKGQKEVVELLLQAGANDYNSVLITASRDGQKDIVELLLQAGADVNTQGGDYGSALIAASLNGQKEVVELLLQAGADVNTKGGDYGSALYAASMNGRKEVAKLLLQAGADMNMQASDHSSALYAASINGRKEVVELLLHAGADVNKQGGYYGSALQAASALGNPDIVKLLLQVGANVNVGGGHYGSALRAASSYGYKEVVKLLLQAGADVNLDGSFSEDEHQAAIVSGSKEVVELLCNARAW